MVITPTSTTFPLSSPLHRGLLVIITSNSAFSAAQTAAQTVKSTITASSSVSCRPSFAWILLRISPPFAARLASQPPLRESPAT
jgi:hypothetical protein